MNRLPAYYNECDPFAAAWLRSLIALGHIAPGCVDERSIEDVLPDDLIGFGQCHFFAGIGVWSHALRAAGVPDDYPIWTGSCPCQPFSAAGKGAGFADERHLWPAWHWLIRQRRPERILGEQVASKAVEPWVDLVHADMEALGYAFGCTAFPAAGVGAPNIRDRAYWMADANHERLEGRGRGASSTDQRAARTNSVVDGLANADCSAGRQGSSIDGRRHPGSDAQSRPGPGGSSDTRGLAHAHDDECGALPIGALHHPEHHAEPRGSAVERPGPVNGFWRDADWLFCRDERWRPAQPGHEPLANGTAGAVGRMQPRLERMGFDPAIIARILSRRDSTLATAGRNRVGRLRGYGNGLNAQAATEFVRAALL